MPENLRELKYSGIPDSIISAFTGLAETEIYMEREKQGIFPAYKAIDTCSGEFFAETPYLYSTYDQESEFIDMDRKKETVVVLGSGPNRISQGLEFDYGSVKAVLKLRKSGFRTVMVNSNPETVSTDFDVSDILYFEPLSLEHICNIIRRESPCRLIIQFSGQTGQNLAMQIREIFGDGIFLGTTPQSIEAIEDRKKFAEALSEYGIKQPEFVTVTTLQEAVDAIEKTPLPVIVRSSFIIGGRAMDIINEKEEVYGRVSALLQERPGFPVLLSRYVEDATEIDVDFVSNGDSFVIAGISVHVEEAGTHSGDATMVLAPDAPDSGTREKIRELVSSFVRKYRLKGFSNLQLALKGDDLFVIELNSRASRSLPFVSKATGVDWISVGIDAMLSGSLQAKERGPKNYFVKIPAFPFNRFLDLDAILGPEMKSTGEGMTAGRTIEEALGKALKMMNVRIPSMGSIVLSISDKDKEQLLEIARYFSGLGHKLVATPGTRHFLRENGLDAEVIYKMEDVREPRIDQYVSENRPDLIINTPNSRSGSIKDGYQIRKLAIRKNIPLITNIKLADALVQTLRAGEKSDFREIREYWEA